MDPKTGNGGKTMKKIMATLGLVSLFAFAACTKSGGGDLVSNILIPWQLGAVVSDGSTSGIIVKSDFVSPSPPPDWVVNQKTTAMKDSAMRGDRDFFTGPNYLPGPPTDPALRARYLFSLSWQACSKATDQATAQGIRGTFRPRVYMQAVKITAAKNPAVIGQVWLRTWCVESVKP